jgi:flagellar motor protein MotB
LDKRDSPTLWRQPFGEVQGEAQIQEHINVNGYTDNTPIGPELAQQGVTTNLILSQKRAETVMNYLIS